MVAVVIEDVVSTTGELSGHLVDYLIQPVTHDRCLAYEQLTVEFVPCALRINNNHTWLLGICWNNTITVLIMPAFNLNVPNFYSCMVRSESDGFETAISAHEIVDVEVDFVGRHVGHWWGDKLAYHYYESL